MNNLEKVFSMAEKVNLSHTAFIAGQSESKMSHSPCPGILLKGVFTKKLSRMK